ncbi:MAG: efflux RND transporter permease subunit, partial [Rickettsiales bacterium]|nr:efflux RND transporter permease subunit [Rickettsiales bacterium]
MLNFFIKRPVTTVMFVLFWVVMGVVSYPKMNVEAQPAMDFPMVTATFVYPGAGPVEIESQIIKRAEDVISEVAGVKKITSQAFESGGFVMAEFKMGVNVNDKAAEMKAKIEAVESQMPADMKKPVIEKLNPLQQSVVDIVLTGSDARSLEQFVSDDFSRKLTGLSGVASATSFGGQTRAIRVQMDPELMAARGISVLDVVGAMGAYNINVPGGKIETSANSNIVRFVGEFASVS